MTYRTHSVGETYSVAADLAATFKGGEIVALEGDLGAGKTTFAQGLCEALGVEAAVTSPTFAIMNVHEVRRGEGAKALRVVHLDLYRLKTAREIAALGLEEYLGRPDVVMLIEWPGAVDGVEWNPTHAVRLSAVSPTERMIEVSRPKRVFSFLADKERTGDRESDVQVAADKSHPGRERRPRSVPNSGA